MNIPDDPNSHARVPERARGNPVYEQTREDMPLWCCGRNCGRNSRYVNETKLSLFALMCSGRFWPVLFCLFVCLYLSGVCLCLCVLPLALPLVLIHQHLRKVLISSNLSFFLSSTHVGISASLKQTHKLTHNNNNNNTTKDWSSWHWDLSVLHVRSLFVCHPTTSRSNRYGTIHSTTLRSNNRLPSNMRPLRMLGCSGTKY